MDAATRSLEQHEHGIHAFPSAGERAGRRGEGREHEFGAFQDPKNPLPDGRRLNIMASMGL
jgi:hypothetical protein